MTLVILVIIRFVYMSIVLDGLTLKATMPLFCPCLSCLDKMRVTHFLCRGICIMIVASGATPLEELVLRLYDILPLDFFEDIDQSTSVFAVSRRLSTPRSIFVCGNKVRSKSLGGTRQLSNRKSLLLVLVNSRTLSSSSTPLSSSFSIIS